MGARTDMLPSMLLLVGRWLIGYRLSIRAKQWNLARDIRKAIAPKRPFIAFVVEASV